MRQDSGGGETEGKHMQLKRNPSFLGIYSKHITWNHTLINLRECQMPALWNANMQSLKHFLISSSPEYWGKWLSYFKLHAWAERTWFGTWQYSHSNGVWSQMKHLGRECQHDSIGKHWAGPTWLDCGHCHLAPCGRNSGRCFCLTAVDLCHHTTAETWNEIADPCSTEKYDHPCWAPTITQCINDICKLDWSLRSCCVTKQKKMQESCPTCHMFHHFADSAMGAVTSLHASPNSMTLAGGLCIMSKKSFVPTAISHCRKKNVIIHFQLT